MMWNGILNVNLSENVHVEHRYLYLSAVQEPRPMHGVEWRVDDMVNAFSSMIHV
jgi:hypothetical protein